MTSAYYDRTGFDRKKLAGSIGDPAALVLQKNSQPVTYQNTKVVQACSVFGPDDIRATGLALRPHSLTVAFARNYFDGKGQGVIRTSGFLQPIGDESNGCPRWLTPTTTRVRYGYKSSRRPIHSLKRSMMRLPRTNSIPSGRWAVWPHLNLSTSHRSSRLPRPYCAAGTRPCKLQRRSLISPKSRLY